MNIKLSERAKVKLLNSDDVFGVMQRILQREDKIDRDREHFWIIGLTINNKVLFIELASMGGVKSTTVEPMNVFRVSVLKNAVKVILAHNHPSGELKPSDADKDLTDRLIQVGKILDIEMIDHLIISLKSYLSFDDTGLMEELNTSIKWLPNFVLEKQIREEEKKIRAKAVKSEATKIAKILKKHGIETALIAKSTGLSKAQIEKLL